MKRFKRKNRNNKDRGWKGSGKENGIIEVWNWENKRKGRWKDCRDIGNKVGDENIGKNFISRRNIDD